MPTHLTPQTYRSEGFGFQAVMYYTCLATTPCVSGVEWGALICSVC